MSRQIFTAVGDGTLKGSALQAVMRENWGHDDFATLDLTAGNDGDQDVFKIGDDFYEIALMTTDTGLDATAEVTAGDVAFTTDAANSLVKGDVIAMETELMVVVASDGLNVNVLRGQFGTTDATHTAGANTSVLTAANALGAGNLACPVFSLTNTLADTDIARAINYWQTGYNDSVGGGRGIHVKAKSPVTAILGTTQVYVHTPATGAVLANSDGTVSAIVDFDATANTITRTDGGSWIDDGFRSGDGITITNAVDGGNNTTYTLTGVTATVFSVASVAADETADTIDVVNDNALANGVMGAFRAGVEPASVNGTRIKYVATAADVTEGTIRFVLPFTPSSVAVTVKDAIIQTAVNVAWDGAVTVTDSLVEVDNSGVVDWAAGNLLIVDAEE